MIFSILSNLTFGGIPYRTINKTYFYEEIRTSLDTCVLKWWVLLFWAQKWIFRETEFSINQLLGEIDFFEESTFSRNRLFRGIDFFEESTFLRNRLFRGIDFFEKSTFSRNRLFREIDYFEESTFSRNKLFRGIDFSMIKFFEKWNFWRNKFFEERLSRKTYLSNNRLFGNLIFWNQNFRLTFLESTKSFK